MINNFFLETTLSLLLLLRSYETCDECPVDTGSFTDEKTKADYYHQSQEIAGEKRCHTKCFPPEQEVQPVDESTLAQFDFQHLDFSYTEQEETLFKRSFQIMQKLLKTNVFIADNNFDWKQDSSTFVPLHHNVFAVPGGRFVEFYYWDSYFYISALLRLNKLKLAIVLTENMIYALQQNGFVPNGNRTYYKTRSQPPLLHLVLKEVYEKLESLGSWEDIRTYFEPTEKSLIWSEMGSDEHLQRKDEFLKSLALLFAQLLEKELAFWKKNAVKDRNGEVLFRFTGKNKGPRKESKEHDEKVRKSAESDEIYLHINATCESGLDFSSQWFSQQMVESLKSRECTEWNDKLHLLITERVFPVYLNVLLANLLKVVADFKEKAGETRPETVWRERMRFVICHFYDKEKGLFFDLEAEKSQLVGVVDFKQWTKTTNKGYFSLNQILLLAFNTTEELSSFKLSPRQILENLKEKFGFVSLGNLLPASTNRTRLNWDHNIWPPIIWFQLAALKNHRFEESYQKLGRNFLLNILEFSFQYMPTNQNGYLMEKIPENFKILDEADYLNFMENKEFCEGSEGIQRTERDANVWTSEGAAAKEGEYEVVVGFGWTVSAVINILIGMRV